MTKQKIQKRKQKFRIALLIGCITAMLAACSYVIIRLIQPIQLKSKDITTEYKEYYDPMSNVKSIFLGDKNEVTTDGTVDTNKKGTYKIRYIYRSKEKYASVRVVDTKAPKIKLKTITTDTIGTPKARDFIQSLQEASPYKTQIKIKHNKQAPGTYAVVITVKDEDGNTTKKKTKMIRQDDIEPPTIKELKPIHMYIGDKVNIKDITVKDDLDPNPTFEINDKKVKYQKPGTYTISYIVSDRSGNKHTYTRKIIIADYDAEVQ